MAGCTPDELVKRKASARKQEINKPEKRVFPKTTTALATTRAYVEAYYRANNLGDYHSLYPNLNTNPTTWPEGPEFEVLPDDDNDVSDLV